MTINRIVSRMALALAMTAAAMSAVSCGSSRKTAEQAAAETPSVTAPGAVSRPPASGVNDDNALNAYNSLIGGYMAWERAEVPFKISVTKPAKLSASGRVYMTRGKDIYISIRVLGMEVANMYVTADSVFASEKVNRRYLAEPLKSITAATSLTVSDIQDILLGRAFIPGKGTADAANADALSRTTANGMMLLTPRKQPQGYEIGFLTDIADRAVTTLIVEPAGSKAIECGYSSPVDSKILGRVNNELSINAEAGSTAINTTLTWQFGDAKSSGVNSARWKQPKGYTRVAAKQLLKMLKF